MLKMIVENNLWDDFLNEKRIERLSKNDDNNAYYVTITETDTEHKTDEFSMTQYTAPNDGDGIQRGFMIVNNMVFSVGLYHRVKSIHFDRENLLETKESIEISRIHYIIRNNEDTEDMNLFFTVNRYK